MSPRRAAPPEAGFLEEAIRRITTSVSEVIPAEAVLHLLNAQRELLLAATAVLEHNRPPKARTGSAARRRPARVKVD